VAKPIDPDLLFAALNTWVSPGQRSMPTGVVAAPAAAGESILSEDLLGINLQEGLKGTGGNAILLHRILMNFLHDHEEDAQVLRKALNEHDMQLAQRVAHTLKGVAGTIGAFGLRGAAIAMDAAIRSRASESYMRLLDRLENNLTRVVHSLKKLEQRQFDRAAPPGDAVPDATTAQQLIERLEGLMHDRDPDAEEAARALQLKIDSPLLQPIMKELVSQLEAYDFVTARHTLSQLKQKLGVSS